MGAQPSPDAGASVVTPANIVWEYATSEVTDPDTGNVEYRLLYGGFHFGTVLVATTGHIIFRPHPEMSDPNGWGTSIHLGAYLAGAEANGATVQVSAGASGVTLSAEGPLLRAGGVEFGHWSQSSLLTYDPDNQRVAGTGTLQVDLDAALASAGADMTLGWIASNYLDNVPRQNGTVGDTGDSEYVNVRYAAAGSSHDFTWHPSVDLNNHYPGDRTSWLGVDVIGQLNDVDTRQQGEGFEIAVARKPTVTMTLAARDTADQMIAGMHWAAAEGQDFAADNVGVMHIEPANASANTHQVFDWNILATVSPDRALTVSGTPGADSLSVSEAGGQLVLGIGGVQTTYPSSPVSSLLVDGLDGDDIIEIGAAIERVVAIDRNISAIVPLPCSVQGGAGYDRITLSAGAYAASISGGAGADTISGGMGGDSITGGDGSDQIRGDAGGDLIDGGLGNDTIMGNTGDDSLSGGDGADQIQAGLGYDLLEGGIGNDTLLAGDQSDTVYGDGDDDYIEGRGKADTIHGGAGNDTIYGGAGSDLIYGDDGNDRIDVGVSAVFHDSVTGGAGTDLVRSDGDDVLSDCEGSWA